MKKRTRTRLTPEVYNKVKILHDMGLKRNAIYEVTGVSPTTFTYITRSIDLDDYHAIRQAVNKKLSHKQPQQPELAIPDQQELDSALTEMLAAFDSKLERINSKLDEVEDLLRTAKSSKRGFWQ